VDSQILPLNLEQAG